MNDGIVTECPECETRFNVSEGQLKLADGKVRCGACLRVFDARAQQPYSQDSVQTDSSAQQSKPEQAYSLHVRHADTPQTDAPSRTAASQAQAPDAAAQSFDPDAPLEVSSLPHAAGQGSAHAQGLDTALDRSLGPPSVGPPSVEPSPAGPSAAGPIPIAGLLRTPSALPEQEPVQPAAQQPARPQAEPFAGMPSSEATSHEQAGTHTEGDTETATPARNRDTAAQDTTATQSALPMVDATQTAQPETATETETTPPEVPQTAAPLAETPKPQGLAALQDLHAEPLELTHPPAPAPAGAILGWSLGCLAACVLLASQLAWYNRIEWSRVPALTEYYDILCNQVECAIPPRQAIELIRNRQLVVRAHPRFEDALSIDLLLENTADFTQPFPAIELSFSDIRGRTVARRVLQPQDYLDDALNPLKMEHSQPFQVNLAILDPGRRAVSYEVQLAPARL